MKFPKQDLEHGQLAVVHLEEFRHTTSYEQLSQLAVKFALENDYIDTVIIGAKNSRQMLENLKIESLPVLNTAQIEFLKKTYKDFNNNCNT